MDRRPIESLYDNGYAVFEGIVIDDVWVPARRQLILKLGELHAGAMGSGGQDASAAACPCWQSARHGAGSREPSICTFFSLLHVLYFRNARSISYTVLASKYSAGI